MKYPISILLLGEYEIFQNSMAIAIPSSHYFGRFRKFESKTVQQAELADKSNRELKKLLLFLTDNLSRYQFIDLDRFEKDIHQGLYFESSVPNGSGLGNSGALTAAIYESYLYYSRHNEFQSIKSDLSALESYFNGQSSGFYPLVSLLKKPLLMKGKSNVVYDIDLSDFFSNYTLFLINANSKENTDTPANFYMGKYQNRSFRKIIDNEYIPIINQTIEAVVSADYRSFETQISRYSDFQLAHFGEMIPQNIAVYFKHGIDSGDFYLKFCDSGKSGVNILGLTRNRSKAETYFNLNHLDWIVV